MIPSILFISNATRPPAAHTKPRNGIDDSEAARRLQHHGPNKVEGAKGLSVWTILLRQVSNSLTLVRPPTVER